MGKKFVCSECDGDIVIEGNELRCTNCGRKKLFQSTNDETKEIDMNDETKNYDDVLFG